MNKAIIEGCIVVSFLMTLIAVFLVKDTITSVIFAILFYHGLHIWQRDFK